MKASYKSTAFVQAPEGSHAARPYQLVDIGIQHSEAYGDKHQIIISYELVDELMEDGRPFILNKFYNLSLNEKATLCIDLEGIAGRKLSDTEKENFDFRKILNAPCLISVIHETKSGEAKAKIKTISALPKNMSASPLKNSPLFFDLDQPDWDVYEKLPEWLQAKINKKSMAPITDDVAFDSEADDIPFS
jgi:hypothetical protein